MVIEVTITLDGFHLCQPQYIKDHLDHVQLKDSKPTSTPMISRHTLYKVDGIALENAILCYTVVGVLQYYTLTRPKISYSIKEWCQFLQIPANVHQITAKRFIRYLKGTHDHGIILSQPSSLRIATYNDVDWASCSDDRRFTSDYCIFLCSSLSLQSFRQQRLFKIQYNS